MPLFWLSNVESITSLLMVKTEGVPSAFVEKMVGFDLAVAVMRTSFSAAVLFREPGALEARPPSKVQFYGLLQLVSKLPVQNLVPRTCSDRTPVITPRTAVDSLSIAVRMTTPCGSIFARPAIDLNPSFVVTSSETEASHRHGGGSRGHRIEPPPLRSLRYSRTVSSRTLNASVMCGLVQPESVSRMARTLSASSRSRQPGKALRAERWSSLAETRDLPPMPHFWDRWR